jgi:S-DNA-T family DNA segregation ATPase FtsK/SpoIIIE
VAIGRTGLVAREAKGLAQMPSKKRQSKRQQGLPITLDRDLQKEILGVLLVAMGAVTALALLSITKGALSEAWVMFLRRIFGWGVYLVALLLTGGGLFLLWEDLRERSSVPARGMFGLEVFLVALLGLSHLLAAPEDALQLAEKGGGGGYIGWAISYFLTTAVGHSVALLLLLLAGGFGAVLFLNPDWDNLRVALDKAKARLTDLSSSEPEPVEAPPVVPKERKRRPKRTRAPEPPEEVKPAPKRRRVRRLDRGGPPLDLLNGGTDESYGDADVRYQKQVIEETLESFGVPATVVEVRQGPTITQFGVEPGFVEYARSDGSVRRRKVKVSKIMALQNDLALALAAAPIRIEAPVPGRSVVGIEVPNTQVSLVGLRGVIESQAFRSIDSRLRVALGRDVAGRPVAADLALMPHLLIAGATGSGKSVCINSITSCLLLNSTPDDLRLIMVDPKMVELTIFDGVPHLLAPVVINTEEAVRALRWVTVQMDERYRLFSQTGMRSIDTYNQLMASRRKERLPHIVILIDELADLMMVAPEEVERSICRIAQLARATGIHLVIATQRPSVDVVTGLIKANFPARISFAVTAQVDSRVILDTGGAERLLGRGDMLYMASDSSKLVRLQGCFVSDEEIERLVRFWRDEIDWIVSQPQAPAPWRDVAFAGTETDELLGQAIELARGRKSISTSFIQRRLHIGYPRAARLIDQMEEQGIVGPPESAGRSREVLIDEYDSQEEDDEPFGE